MYRYGDRFTKLQCKYVKEITFKIRLKTLNKLWEIYSRNQFKPSSLICIRGSRIGITEECIFPIHDYLVVVPFHIVNLLYRKSDPYLQGYFRVWRNCQPIRNWYCANRNYKFLLLVTHPKRVVHLNKPFGFHTLVDECPLSTQLGK